ncbi:hypothetical protein AMTR_s00013p00205570 [Amborella trichopoda]|uniref:DET1- and DDB1-associated protein 1 domain-containing protein n=1 Tax=Amborella trichopoda TaxID=13333 RepID=W1PRS9_AMBTC|nr:hypothetical protein AMTR_s00013p00205570 [Amborella trichopoda]
MAGASKYLLDLPSRGLFSSTIQSTNPGSMRVYICDHDTSPPEEQLIKTNQTNILIRSLTLKKQKGESKVKDTKGKGGTDNAKGKRSAERAVDSRTSVKRANVANGSSSSRKGSDFVAQKSARDAMRVLENPPTPYPSLKGGERTNIPLT